MAIYNTLVPITTPAELSSGSGNRAITTVIVCNWVAFNPSAPTDNEATVTLYAIPAADVGGGALAKHMIVNQLPVPAGETVTFDSEKIVLSDGDALFAVASNSNLTATVSTLAV